MALVKPLQHFHFVYYQRKSTLRYIVSKQGIIVTFIFLFIPKHMMITFSVFVFES
jgi:hypothetical protein